MNVVLECVIVKQLIREYLFLNALKPNSPEWRKTRCLLTFRSAAMDFFQPAKDKSTVYTFLA